MSNLSDQQWSNLNPQQRDGLSCVWCNSSAQPMQPVGHSATTGSQAFACTGPCVGHLEAVALMAEHLGETAPIDVVAAQRQLDDPLIKMLAKGRVTVDEARDAIDEAEAEGIDVAFYRAELARIGEKLAELAVEVEATS